MNITPTANVSYAQQFMDKYWDSLKTQEGVLGKRVDGMPEGTDIGMTASTGAG